MTAPAMEVLRSLKGFRATGTNQWEAKCPGHEDGKASLGVSIGTDGRVLLTCRAGCELDSILSAAGIPMRDIFPDKGNGHHHHAGERPSADWKGRAIACWHPYVDENGNVLYWKARINYMDADGAPAKEFLFWADGSWGVTKKNIRRVPWHLDRLVTAEELLIVEGESDVLAADELGFVATTLDNGANADPQIFVKCLRPDQRVIVIGDSDKPGREYRKKVLSALRPRVASLKSVDLPDMPEREKDLRGWLNHRRDDIAGAAERLSILIEAAPEWAPAESEKPADPWQVSTFTLADAYRDRPKREDIVEGLFSECSLSIVYGQPGCLKSALLADMACCVAGGLPFLPRDPGDLYGMITKPVPVHWADFDNGELTFNRFEAFGKARNLPDNLPLYFSIMPDPWLDGGNEQHMAALAARIEARGVKLLIVDNFKTVCGDLDENKPEVARVMSHFRRLVDRLRICAILIHHPPKADDEVLRGHGSILSALDLSLHCRRDTKDHVFVKPIKTRSAIPDAFTARFEYTHKAGSKEMETARFWRVGDAGDQPIKLNRSEIEVLVFIVNAGTASIKDITQGVRHTSPETAKRSAWTLASMELIVRTDHGGKGQEAVLSPTPKGVQYVRAQVKFPCSKSETPCDESFRTSSGESNDR